MVDREQVRRWLGKRDREGLTYRELPSEVESLIARVVEREAQIVTLNARIAQLEHAVNVLTKIQFTPKSERRPEAGYALGPGQMHLLFPELIEAAERIAKALST